MNVFSGMGKLACIMEEMRFSDRTGKQHDRFKTGLVEEAIRGLKATMTATALEREL